MIPSATASEGHIFAAEPKSAPSGLLKVLDADSSCKEDKVRSKSGSFWLFRLRSDWLVNQIRPTSWSG